MSYDQPQASSSITAVVIQNSSYTYAADAEASDAYAITLSPAVTAYAAGQTFKFKANTANTGGATLNVNALGAKNILKQNNVALATGDIEAGSIVTVTYDGTSFQMTSSDANVSAAEIANTPAGSIAATTVQAAIDELATEKEPTKGADDNYVTDAEKVVIGNTSGTNTGDEPTANTTTEGVVEIAIASEVNTGTDAGRAVSPDALAGSNLGTKAVQIVVFDFTTDTATGDGKAYFRVPPSMGGMDLVSVAAHVITAGTTNTTDVQIHNLTQAADMLTTKLTIDSAELDTSTAATPAVIDGGNDDVASGDILRIDVDAVSTTAAKGLMVSMEFRLP